MTTLLKSVENAGSREVNLIREKAIELTAFETDLRWLAVGYLQTSEDCFVLKQLALGHRHRRAAIHAIKRQIKGFNDEAECIELGFTTDAIPSVQQFVDQLCDFAAGEPVSFNEIAVDSSHLTPFTQSVHNACRSIAWGETRTYGQLAQECGSPHAARAVGSVMAKNRYPLVVPCHRVVGAAGHLGGFSAPGGLVTKRKLLALESRNQTIYQ